MQALLAIAIACLMAISAWPQVVAPSDWGNPELRRLQEKYPDRLTSVAAEVKEHGFLTTSI